MRVPGSLSAPHLFLLLYQFRVLEHQRTHQILQSDPLKYGALKRIIREKQHLTKVMASTKKCTTLGESDRIQEVVLVHSVLSYKKVRRC